ncbi:hypothetical protein [Salinicola tamaricis]
MAETSTPRPVALLILDGYGRTTIAPPMRSPGPSTPVMDRLKRDYPNT